MAGRTRTTKGLAGRIQWAYYKKIFPIPRWRKLLTWSFLLAGLLWVAWYALARNSAIYSSGPLTRVHQSFGSNCTSCHNQSLAVGKTVTDAKCLACHDGPAHSDQQVSVPTCSSCHLEHRGTEVLIASSNESCVNCHSSLQVKKGTPKVAAHIKSFTDGHPEFAALAKGATDPGNLKFSHKAHLAGAATLNCADCHKTVAPDSAGDPDSPRPRRAYFAPVKYKDDCSTCHALDFDARINEPAPHTQPGDIHTFLVEKFTAYIAAHPDELHKKPEAERIPRQAVERVPSNAKEWVGLRVRDAENLLWTKTCVQCHTLVGFTPTEPDSLPAVVPPGLNNRWLTKGNFNHSAHSASQCSDCHAGAVKSETASDVMIPGIAKCQECHNSSLMHQGFNAGATCLQCHQYHNWNKEKDVQRAAAGSEKKQ